MVVLPQLMWSGSKVKLIHTKLDRSLLRYIIYTSFHKLGDILSIDTASITGEPLPRNYPSEQYGALILTGTTVKAGEAYCVVRKTGINTEVRCTRISNIPIVANHIHRSLP